MTQITQMSGIPCCHAIDHTYFLVYCAVIDHTYVRYTMLSCHRSHICQVYYAVMSQITHVIYTTLSQIIHVSGLPCCYVIDHTFLRYTMQYVSCHRSHVSKPLIFSTLWRKSLILQTLTYHNRIRISQCGLLKFYDIRLQRKKG